MAVGDLTIFNDFTRQLADKQINLGTDAYKLGLVTNSPAPLVGDTNPEFGDYTEVGIEGNYAAGGKTVSGSMLTTLSGADTLWDIGVAGPHATWLLDAAGPASIRWGILYNDQGATKYAAGFVDFGGGSDISLVDADLKYTFNATSITKISRLA